MRNEGSAFHIKKADPSFLMMTNSRNSELYSATDEPGFNDFVN